MNDDEIRDNVGELTTGPETDTRTRTEEGHLHMDLLAHNLAQNERIAQRAEEGIEETEIPFQLPHEPNEPHEALASADLNKQTEAAPDVGKPGPFAPRRKRA